MAPGDLRFCLRQATGITAQCTGRDAFWSHFIYLVRPSFPVAFAFAGLALRHGVDGAVSRDGASEPE